ncbi:hypothetical protein GGR52DRAFT_494656 [Hypoxylon sp. FL1284]|nr:hypothetical protein GGR52DRAFT_494656 [Hypoxylon sp. FL1284]
MSQPNADINPHYFGGDLQRHGSQLTQSFDGLSSLNSEQYVTTPTPLHSHGAFSNSVQLHNLDGNPRSALPSETPLAQQVSWNNTVSFFPQRETFDFQLPAGARSASLPGDGPAELPMRYIHSNLAVLSAEQYDIGRPPKRAASKVIKKPTTAVVPIDDGLNPKKRGRARVDAETTEAATEKKRARGRPRLETTDQSPAERRRTQIRLAQRAHRNRKENAIKDLQTELDSLKEVNSEINSAYKSLFDYASQRGLLAQAPKFRQQLQRVQSLVKQAQEKGGLNDSEEGSPDRNLDDGVREAQEAKGDTPPENEEETTAPAQPEPQATRLWGGLMVSHEPVVYHTQPGTANLDPALAIRRRAHGYEIATAPPPENASFGASVPLHASSWEANWAQHPWNRLTGPRSLATNEWAFARRLHRQSQEKALLLASMPNPPTERMMRVFGCVLLFESLDEIRARTKAVLDRTRDDPLSYWANPFHHLGGAGTHFPCSGPSSLAGASSSAYQSTGFGMGPFDARAMRVRDDVLGDDQYINKAGWEGVWYDAGDVEAYLAQNGVVIPTAADVHRVEIHPGAFSDVQTLSQVQVHPSAASEPPGHQTFDSGSSSSVPPSMGGTSFAVPSSVQPNANSVPARVDLWPPVSGTPNLYDAAPSAHGNAPSFTGFDNLPCSNSSYLYPPHESTGAAPIAAPRKAVLDVNSFIDALISHATCLGRAPAFRPRDIVSAFWSSLINDEDV